jgi:hypothetical protein
MRAFATETRRLESRSWHRACWHSIRNVNDRIDHRLNGHDDLANAVAGAAVFASQRQPEIPLVGPILVSRADVSPPSGKSYGYCSGTGRTNFWGPI